MAQHIPYSHWNTQIKSTELIIGGTLSSAQPTCNVIPDLNGGDVGIYRLGQPSPINFFTFVNSTTSLAGSISTTTLTWASAIGDPPNSAHGVLTLSYTNTIGVNKGYNPPATITLQFSNLYSKAIYIDTSPNITITNNGLVSGTVSLSYNSTIGSWPSGLLYSFIGGGGGGGGFVLPAFYLSWAAWTSQSQFNPNAPVTIIFGG